MRQIIPLNNNWEFTSQWTNEFLNGRGEVEAVRLPHTCKVIPYDYFDEGIYQMVCGYRKRLDLSARGARHAFVRFGAAAHYAKVYLDGKLIGEHKSGYTAFELPLDTDNPAPLLAVELDTRESLNFPPFGKVIDYLTYGGLYREVQLEYRESSYIADLFAKPTYEKTKGGFDGTIACALDATGEADALHLTVAERGGEAVLAEVTADVQQEVTLTVPQIKRWEPAAPVLYTVRAELIRGGEVVDAVCCTVGFRTAEFKKDGFYLNGEKFKLRGLNRHQSYPFVGYAMPRAMQRMDADILKYELGCNAVRTSHYPQSHHFIERCDELGMPVFTELPGWQNLGDAEWKDVAVESVKEMVREYRNHPSIVLWGVRINESQDDHDFYVRTNAAARALDPTRATGGVRCHKNSELLEDVYTYNDFVHDGEQPGCEPKSAVTSDPEKAYLISEYGGHMYSTKAYATSQAPSAGACSTITRTRSSAPATAFAITACAICSAIPRPRHGCMPCSRATSRCWCSAPPWISVTILPPTADASICSPTPTAFASIKMTASFTNIPTRARTFRTFPVRRLKSPTTSARRLPKTRTLRPSRRRLSRTFSTKARASA